MRSKILRLILVVFFVALSILYTKVKLDNDTGLMQTFSALAVFVLLIYYTTASIKVNIHYIAALVSLLVADLLFVYDEFYLYMSGLTFFLLYNASLLMILIGKIGLIKKSHLYKIVIPTTILFLSLTYLVFAGLSNLKALIIIFGVILSFLISAALGYYTQSSKKSSIIMLIGVLLLVANYVFGGMNKLLLPSNYYEILESISYSVGIFLITKAMIIEDKNNNKNALG